MLNDTKLTCLKSRRLYLSDPDNRESVTSVKTICADGTVTDPFHSPSRH